MACVKSVTPKKPREICHPSLKVTVFTQGFYKKSRVKSVTPCHFLQNAREICHPICVKSVTPEIPQIA